MLADLPAELLNQIIAFSPAGSLGRLAQTSHALHDFVEKEGWRTFAQTHFPSLNYPPYWRDASHSLTTLSRNWRRRAFIAQYLEPAGDVTALPSRQQVRKWRRPGGQTMGFQPAVDSYEEFIGAKWSDRREVVAWSAGAELVVRVRVRNASTEQVCRAASPQEQKDNYETNGTRTRWWTYKPFSSIEGRDDITTVKILRPKPDRGTGEVLDRRDQIIIGTANGDLQMLTIPMDGEGRLIQTYYVTNGVPVRSASLSPCNDETEDLPRQLAVNLSDARLVLYNIDPSMKKIAPVSEINAIPQGKRGCRIWSTKFLNTNRMAVGLGPSTEPVHIFEMKPDGIVEEPIRKLGLSGDADALGPVRASSIYPIEPLLDVNGGRGEGNIFLSGGYDGVVRLHDLRSPSSFDGIYRDPTDDAAIYSLLSRGRDRVVAGTSRHGLLKIFDLRITGGSQYNWTDVSTASHAYDATSSPGDWNIFINPRDRYANSSWRGPNSWMRRSAEGSVYNLSSPSPISPFIYAGVENAVVEFNFSSVLDRHPDPMFSGEGGSCTSRGGSAANEVARRGPCYIRNTHEVLNLAMYAQDNEGAKEAMKLRTQRSVGETLAQARNPTGLDERWKDSQ